MFNFLNGYKTYIVAASAFLYSVTQYWNGEISQPAFILAVMAALGAASMRHGISTSK